MTERIQIHAIHFHGPGVPEVPGFRLEGYGVAIVIPAEHRRALDAEAICTLLRTLAEACDEVDRG